MSTTEFPLEDLHDDAPLGEEAPLAGAVEVTEPDTELDAQPRCEKCGAKIRTSDMLACRSCGWYASIGGYVEIDQTWEAHCDPDAEQQPADEEENLSVPTWAIVLGATVLGVIAISVFARLTTPATSMARTSWALTQLGVGFVAFASCHFVCFTRLMSAKAETNLLDILLSPHKCWTLLWDELPEHQWMAHGAAGGLTAVLMSLLVIGGIPYHVLLDWGFEKPPEQNLMAAVMEQAQQIEGEEKSMEEAIEDFAGSANVDDLEGDDQPEPPAEEESRLETDAVVLGYRTNEDGLVSTLVIGVEHKGALVYAGRVMPDLPADQLEKLTENLGQWKTSTPFVTTDVVGTIWVVPKQVCLVSYRRQGKGGWLYEAKFEKLRSVLDW